MKITKAYIKKVVKSGNWMLRRSDAGKSYGDFQWAPIGEWTEAPDWDPNPICGGGLHGNGPNSKGYWTDGSDIDFCEIDPQDVVDLYGEKIKAKRSRILLRNELPDGLTLEGGLDFRECTGLTRLPNKLTVKGTLNLTRCSNLKSLPEDLKIKGNINLRGCSNLTTLPKKLETDGWVNLWDCRNLTKLPESLIVQGSLYIIDCPKLTSLPKKLFIGGQLNIQYSPNITTSLKNMEIKGPIYD